MYTDIYINIYIYMYVYIYIIYIYINLPVNTSKCYSQTTASLERR